jgi:hypothetical protein
MIRLENISFVFHYDMKHKKEVAITTILLFFASTKAVFAQLGNLNNVPYNTKLPLNVTINNFIYFSVGSGVVVFMFMLVRGALEWIFSEGEKGALTAARTRMTNAVIGLIILASVFAIMQIVQAVTFTSAELQSGP